MNKKELKAKLERAENDWRWLWGEYQKMKILADVLYEKYEHEKAEASKWRSKYSQLDYKVRRKKGKS